MNIQSLRNFVLILIFTASSTCFADIVTFQYVAEVNFDPTNTYSLGQTIDIIVTYDTTTQDEHGRPAGSDELSYELINTTFVIDGNVITYVRPVMNVWGASAWEAEGYQVVNNGDGMTGSIGGQPVVSASINCSRGWTGTWTSALFDAPPPLVEMSCNGSLDFIFDPTGETTGLTFDVIELILDFDEDDDGISDEDDLCSGTDDGDAVDATGCSISQICPCDGFRTHGGYVSCVSHTANGFADMGLITKSQRNSILSSAANNSCGE